MSAMNSMNAFASTSKGNGYAASAGERSEEEEPEELDGRKRKRKRLALSCSECKRRKIKCDRESPCGNCAKRKIDPALCVMELPGLDMLPQSIARSADLQDAVARIAKIEQYLKNLAGKGSQLPPFRFSIDQDSSTARSTPHDDGAESFSDTEDATVSLERGVAFLSGPGPTRKAGDTDSHLPLTSAFTSILHVEGPVTAATSRVHLHLDFDATPSQVLDGKRQLTARILRALPTADKVASLIKVFFEKRNWLFHSVQESTFLSEYDAFQSLISQGRELEVDPLWLSLLCMILCLSLDAAPSLSPSAAEALSQASQLGLHLAEWETTPRIRSVQVIILFCQYLQLSSANSSRDVWLKRDVWLGGAVRIAMALGLNRLGTNQETMPADDIAFPSGKNVAKREQAKRLWGILVYIDWMSLPPVSTTSNQHISRSYLIQASDFDTEPPSNVNDNELSPLTFVVNPLSFSVRTDSTADIARLAIAHVVRRTADAGIHINYDTILLIDKSYRDILSTLPKSWSVDLSPEETAKPDFQRHFLIEGINNRLFRLHRPQATRHEYSNTACVRAAKAIILTTTKIHAAILGMNLNFAYSHCFSATLILFQDLFQAIDRDRSTPAEIVEKEATLQLAAKLFSRGAELSSTGLRGVVEQGSKVISGLFLALDKRRSVNLLLSLGGERRETDFESFAEILNRLAHSLSTYERHEGTPPPSRRMAPLPSVPNWPGNDSTDDIFRFLNMDMMAELPTPGSMFDTGTFPLDGEWSMK